MIDDKEFTHCKCGVDKALIFGETFVPQRQRHLFCPLIKNGILINEIYSIEER
jgi:hypothetical protein